MATASVNDVTPPSDPSANPPFLRRVRIRGYKSIAFCDVYLQPLTILVGRNSSSKSNFLDALAFLSDVVAKGVDETVRLHGGRHSILNRSDDQSAVSFEIEACYQNADFGKNYLAKYEIVIEVPIQAKPFFVSERLWLSDLRNALFDSIRSQSRTILRTRSAPRRRRSSATLRPRASGSWRGPVSEAAIFSWPSGL